MYLSDDGAEMSKAQTLVLRLVFSFLAGVQNIPHSLLFRGVHAQLVKMLDFDPRSHIFAVVSFVWRKPLGRVLIAFALVDVVGHG